MDDETKQELSELRKMMESEGWRIYVRHTQEQLDHLRKNGWTAIQNTDQLQFAKGCMQTLENIVNHDKVIEAMLVQQDLPLEDA